MNHVNPIKNSVTIKSINSFNFAGLIYNYKFKSNKLYSTKKGMNEVVILKKIMFVLFLGVQLVFVSSCKNESDKAHL